MDGWRDRQVNGWMDEELGRGGDGGWMGKEREGHIVGSFFHQGQECPEGTQ